MKKIALQASIILVLVFLAATLGAATPTEGIKVGVLLPLTGKLADFGEIERKSFLMAADEINETGGIDGEPIHLMIEDTGGKPKTGQAAMQKLIFQIDSMRGHLLKNIVRL